jgi:hypothetical protein
MGTEKQELRGSQVAEERTRERRVCVLWTLLFTLARHCLSPTKTA